MTRLVNARGAGPGNYDNSSYQSSNRPRSGLRRDPAKAHRDINQDTYYDTSVLGFMPLVPLDGNKQPERGDESPGSRNFPRGQHTAPAPADDTGTLGYPYDDFPEQHIETVSQPSGYAEDVGYEYWGDRAVMDHQYAPPDRIPRPFYPAMRHLGGMLTGRYTNSHAFLPPPVFSRPSINLSIRGTNSQGGVQGGRFHVPAVFVPRSIG